MSAKEKKRNISVTENTDKKQKKKFSLLWLIVILPFGLALGAYIGIAAFFSDRFYFGSIINGTDYTGRSVEDVENSMKEDIYDYRLVITGRDGIVSELSAEDIGLTFVSDGKIQELLENQNPFLWPLAYFREESYEMSATTTYDRKKAEEALGQLAFFDKEQIIKPKNATYYEAQDGTYQIKEEVKGNQLIKKKVLEKVLKAVEQGDTELLLENEDYRAPNITKEYQPLVRLVDTLNRYTSITITYDFKDRTKELTGEEIKKWLVIDGYEVSLDEGLVREYIDDLARTYNTFGKTREFISWDGSIVTVKGGDYGWLISRSVETNALIDVIKEGKSVTREPIYLYSAYNREEYDIGDTYVEINLTAQHMWFFKNGECLVDTPVVTGNISRSYDTPTGTFQITYKERNATLKGEDYRTPVNYWMPFYYNVGIHDADWRKEFGKEIYKTNGSHGCVNTPPANAKIIFENIEAGVPVVVYKKKLKQEVLDQLNGVTKEETKTEKKESISE